VKLYIPEVLAHGPIVDAAQVEAAARAERAALLHQVAGTLQAAFDAIDRAPGRRLGELGRLDGRA
jgi:hypothetical protein